MVTKSAADHIKDSHHVFLKTSNIVSKKSSIIKRTNGGIKINNVTITKHQWHSIIDDECLLCNEPVEDPFNHFANFTHMIKLIQSEILFKDNHYYRKV